MQDSNRNQPDQPPSRKRRKREAPSILWHFESMDRVNRAMQGIDDLEQVMKDVLDTLLSVFECDRAWLVYPCEPDSPTWQVPMERTRPEYPGVLPIRVDLPLDPAGAEIYRILRDTDGPVKFGPAERYAVPLEIAFAFQVQSFMAMAFYPKIGKPWSVGLHQCSYARVWTPEEERLFREIGRRLSDTLSSLLAYRNLQESEKQMKQLIDASPVAMAISSGSEERVESINDKFIELFGYTIEDMPSVKYWWPLAYPDENYRAEIKAKWEAKVERAIRERSQIEPMEATVRCKDGSLRHIEFRLASIGEKHVVTFVDLTERKRAEEALSASEAELRTLINTMTDIVFVGNSEGRFLKIVDTSPSLLYKPPKDLLGRTLHEVFPKDLADFFLDHLRQALSTQRSVNFEYRLPIGDQEMWFYATVSPMTDDKTLMVARDITDLKRAETQLLASEQLFRALVENSPDFIARYDREFRRIYVNPAIQKLFGVPAEDVLGKTPADQSPVYAPQVYIDHLKQVIETAAETAIEMPFRTATGEIHWGHMRFVPEFGPDDKVNSVLAIGRDIQEIKENERRFSMLAENFPDLVMRFDREGRYIYVNPAFEKAFDMPADSVVGRTLQELPAYIKAQQNDTSMAGIRRAFDEGVTNQVEARWNTGSGERIFENRYVPEKDAAGDVVTVLCIARDLTEQKQAEDELRERERHAQSLLRLSRKLEQAQTYVDVLNAAQEEVREIIGYQNLWAYLFTPDKQQAKALFAQGPMSEQVMSQDGTGTITIQGDRMMEELLETAEIQVIEDAQIDERTDKDIAAKMRNRTLVHVPILLFDQLMGSIGMGTFGEEGIRVPTASEREYLIALASHMAATIDRILLLERRNQMEQELIAREREFRTLAEYSPDNIARYDVNGRTIYVNPTLEKTLGHPASEMLGTLPSEAGFIAEAKEFQEKIAEVLKTGKENEMDLVLPDMGDGLHYHNIRFVAERGADGTITAIQAIGRDITERKRAEQALRESEERLLQITSSLREVVWLRDAKTRQVLYVNPAFLKLTGRTCESFYQNRDLVLDAVHPDDKKWLLEALEQRSESVSFDTEHRIIHLDGSVRWVSSRSFAVRNEAGEVYRWASFMEDITERKLAESALRESEEKFRLLHENAGVGIGYYTPDGEIISYNQLAASHMQGKPEDFIGKSIYDVFPSEEAEFYMGRIRASLETDATLEYEDHLDLPSGEKWFLSIFTRICDTQQNVTGVQIISQDITEQKQAEEALRASENRFRILSETAFVGVYIIQDGRLSYVNSTLAEIFGYTVEELTGADPRLVIYPEDHQLVLENIRRRIDGEIETIHYEFRGLRKDGEIKNIEVFGGRIAFGGKTAVIGNLLDITERKRAEEALRNSERRLIEAQRTAHVGYWERNFEAGHMILSDEACRIFGLSPQEVPFQLEQWHQLWLELIHPEDRPRTSKAAAAAIADDSPYNVEYRIIRPSGDVRFIHSEASVRRDESGRPLYMLGMMQDITDRKQAEDELRQNREATLHFSEQLAALQEVTNELSKAESSADLCRQAVQWGRSRLGFDRVSIWFIEEHLGIMRGSFGTDEHGELRDERNAQVEFRHEGLAWSLFSHKEQAALIEHRPLYDHLAREVGMGDNAMAGLWDGGNVIGVISVDNLLTDRPISEHDLEVLRLYASTLGHLITRKRAEEQLRQLNQELERRVVARTAQLAEANEELESFAYSVSHDLRAPLRHVDGFIELLQKRIQASLDEKSQHYMEMITDSSRKMGVLIDDLLSFSRMSRAEMVRLQVDLNELVRDVIEQFALETLGRAVEWKIGLLPQVTGDRAMLRVALVNLISNALKFTSNRKPARIEIETLRVDGTEVVLFVRDNGVGFDMKYANNLFGVFQRLHHSDEFEGTGIGLASVRRIINRHGGRIWAESQIGQGATFYFSIPTSTQEKS